MDNNKWTPISESLPPNGEEVLFFMNSGFYIGWYSARADEICTEEWSESVSELKEDGRDVDTAWMPLPEPFRKE